MTMHGTRRDFLASTAIAGATLAAAGRLPAAEFKTKLKKALIGKPTEALLTAYKAAGLDGVESNHRNATPDEAAAARKIAEGLGMKIHSVLYGWANFNNPDKAKVDADIASVEASLAAAQAYGATALLLVPCKIGGMAMPEAWEFDIDFDEKTGHVRKVVKGDNSKYQDYMAAQNLAVDTSREAIKRLIPVAEKTGVVIAVENVWNNLWVKPEYAANFTASFGSPWVKFYFDIGNHVAYAPPQHWIRTLGKQIVKMHVKDYKFDPKAPKKDGKCFAPVREGSVDWPEVRRAIEEVGYNGFLTVEGPPGNPEEASKRLDLIIAGK